MKRKTLLERWAEDTEGLTFKGEPGYKDDWEDEPEPEEEKEEWEKGEKRRELRMMRKEEGL